MSAWIKCSDQLPGSGLVLAFSPQPHDVMGPISVQQAASLIWWHGQYPNQQFTYWMPLPAAPIESEAVRAVSGEGG